MKNIGLLHYKHLNVDNFTTNYGIWLRKIINKPLRFLIKLCTKGKIIVENYPDLPKQEPFIFAATHSFVEEVPALLATIDRSAYSLLGSTDQLEYNKRIYANWLTGFIYVDRQDRISRQESLFKMKRILDSGSSILIFPEGGWNNSENLLVQNLFSGVYNLASLTKAKVIPISAFNVDNTIYIKTDNPLDLANKAKDEALVLLRDHLATLMWQHIEEHGHKFERIFGDSHLNFMQERKNEYFKVKWSHDVFDEELTVYKDKRISYPEDVWKVFEQVEITKHNARFVFPIKQEIKRCSIYNFKQYMHDTFQNKE